MTDRVSETFDFEDGRGPVPARRHPNGGGWVADTATVAETAYVGPDARVYGNARVSGNAWVSGNAQVFGKAKVYENAQVYGHAWIYDNAQVYENRLLICGKAKISSRKDIVAPGRGMGYARGGKVQVSMYGTRPLKDLVGNPYYLRLEELIEAALEMGDTKPLKGTPEVP